VGWGAQHGGSLEEMALRCGGQRHGGIRGVITGDDLEMRKKEKKEK
jgi:hypothetical protein